MGSKTFKIIYHKTPFSYEFFQKPSLNPKNPDVTWFKFENNCTKFFKVEIWGLLVERKFQRLLISTLQQMRGVVGVCGVVWDTQCKMRGSYIKKRYQISKRERVNVFTRCIAIFMLEGLTNQRKITQPVLYVFNASPRNQVVIINLCLCEPKTESILCLSWNIEGNFPMPWATPLPLAPSPFWIDISSMLNGTTDFFRQFWTDVYTLHIAQKVI